MSTTTVKFWHIKEFSKITNVSVRALHYYESLNLLKPKIQPHNGYRLYSKSDLLKLQQILAFKYFGFKLKDICKIMSNNINPKNALHLQIDLLKQQIAKLKNTKQCINAVLCENADNESINWHHAVQLIKVYEIMNNSKNTWVSKLLSENEMKEYAALYSKFSEDELNAFETRWKEISNKITTNLDKSPQDNIGKEICLEINDLTEPVYRGHMELRSKIWQGIKSQKAGNFSLNVAQSNWINQAMVHHFTTR